MGNAMDDTVILSQEEFEEAENKMAELETKLQVAVEALEKIGEDTTEFFEKPRPSLMADIANQALLKIR